MSVKIMGGGGFSAYGKGLGHETGSDESAPDELSPLGSFLEALFSARKVMLRGGQRWAGERV